MTCSNCSGRLKVLRSAVRLSWITAIFPFRSRRIFPAESFVAGPGDVGRAIRCRSPKARVDCVDSRLVPIVPLCGTEHGVEMSAKSLLAIYASQTGVQVSLPTTTRSSQANALGWVLRPWRNFSDTCFDCCGRGLFVFLQLGIRRSEVWRGIG